MNKKVAVVGLSLVLISLFAIWMYINSPQVALSNAQRDTKNILKVGADFKKVKLFLKEQGFKTSKMHKAEYRQDGNCRWWLTDNLKWDCQYAAYTYAEREYGYMNPFYSSSRVAITIFLDKNERIREYHWGTRTCCFL